MPDIAVADLERAIDGPGSCGASDLVKLRAIRLPGGNRVVLEPAAKARCRMAEIARHWVRVDIAPMIERSEARLARLQVSASYDCRPRNRVESARISEHGAGNALDPAAIARLTVEWQADYDAGLAPARSLGAAIRVCMGGRGLLAGAVRTPPDGIHMDEDLILVARR